MGKKPNVKAKERKAERKAMEMKMNSGVYSVKKANAQTDPLEPLPSFTKFERNGVNLVLEARRAGSLDTSLRDWIFDLTERNMQEMYTKVRPVTTIAISVTCCIYHDQSEWGWNGEVKRKELNEDAAWFLVAKEKETEVPVAFSHFRSELSTCCCE